MQPDAINIRHALQPGDLGMVVHLHGLHYARDFGLDTTFEPYVAMPLAEFVQAGRGRLWIAEAADRTVGSIAVVDAGEKRAQLRWFLVVPEGRGKGLGKRLLDGALDYCRERGDQHVFLWTFAGLDSAMALYERAGFAVTEQKTAMLWGAERTEVRMDLALKLPLARSAPS